MKKFAIGLMGIAIAAGAQAQWFGELGYTTVKLQIKDEDLTIKSSPQALRAIVGHELSPNFAAEGMVALGLKGSGVELNGSAVPSLTLKVRNAVGIYAKPKLKLNDQVELFARVGYARVSANVSSSEESRRVSESGASFGAGLSYAINTSTSLNADYMQYLNKDGAKVRGLTVGVGMRF